MLGFFPKKLNFIHKIKKKYKKGGDGFWSCDHKDFRATVFKEHN
jgi:hypothetical protein